MRLRIYTPRERSTERAFIPSLLFFFSFLSAHLVALSYSSRPVHARARVVVVVVVVVVVGGGGGGGGGDADDDDDDDDDNEQTSEKPSSN